ncbi:MAG: protein kinase [Polyangiales bacterium]|nr:protein kinase [Myxococcales bacterium]
MGSKDELATRGVRGPTPRSSIESMDTLDSGGPRDEPKVPALPPGTRVNHYEIVRELGRGGMGVVYQARDLVLGRRVALKQIAYSEPELVRRLLAEARATARCHHENIVVIHEVDEHEGRPYLVLEHLQGRTLGDLADEGTMPSRRAAELIVPVLRALVHAHGEGLVHRDLKPDNVFVTTSGVVKVLDFGIAKVFEEEARAVRHSMDRMSRMSLGGPHTHHDVVVGTLPYMAPEQLRGADVDGRSDLYAVGVILYELVVGHHPLGQALEPIHYVAFSQGSMPMPSLDEAEGLDPALAGVLGRALASDPDERFADAAEMLAALERFVGSGARALAQGEGPYPGLGAFDEAQAGLFFGRTADVRRVVHRLRDHALVTVAGPSGVGKSSLVHAGVIPQLRAEGERYEVRVLRPGRRPLAALSGLAEWVDVGASELANRVSREPGALASLLRARSRRKRTRIALVVDQFEELYTLCGDEEERARFTGILRSIADDDAGSLRVIVCVRGDFVHRVAEDPQLVEQLTEGLLFLAPLGRSALREALVEPARLAGYRFEDDASVEAIVDASESAGDGALPSLQFVAAKLWEARDSERRVLTRAALDALGGVEGALAAHADEVLSGLGPAARREARRLLPRLVTPERTRAVETVEALLGAAEDRDAASRIVERLIEARLLVAHGDEDGERTVEIVHESLIERWPLLAEAYEAQREELALRHQLRLTATQWVARDEPDGLLWTGGPLNDARALLERGQLGEVERRFLERALASERRARRRARGWRVALLGGLSLVVAGAFVATIAIAAAERSERASAEVARDEAQRALAAEHEAREQARRAETALQERLDAERREQSANATVARQEEDLQAANVRLQETLGELEREAQRARSARDVAEREAARARGAEQEVRALLSEKEAQVRQLRERLRTISTELR